MVQEGPSQSRNFHLPNLRTDPIQDLVELLLARRHLEDLHLKWLVQPSHSLMFALMLEGDRQEIEVDRHEKELGK